MSVTDVRTSPGHLPRVVAPEILDDLTPDDPLALGSRRDLRRVNAIMRHTPVLARALAGGALGRVLEIGAGDGYFALGLAQRLPVAGKGTTFTLLDLRSDVPDHVRGEFARMRVECEPVTSDVFAYLADSAVGRFDAIVANLFLHHFEADRLAELLRLVAARTDRFAACEPRRSREALVACRALPLLRCNEVTRHDAVVSVRAGFRDRELSELWPSEDDWTLTERAVPPFSHAFRAVRA